MTTGLDPNKAKTARRVIEVLEFFDEQNRQATVMDIARRYKRPQSSTSELLAILVEMGLLYKDPNSRCFMPTPRAAMLGSLFQPSLVRDGRLSMLTERLSAQTGLSVAVMGMVGLDVQIFRWIGGARPLASSLPNGLSGGVQAPLYESPAGWLLLSTLAPERRDGMLRRLRAEAAAEQKFSPAEIADQVQACGQSGFAVGPAGFGTAAQMCAMLLPGDPGERPLVLAFVYEPNENIDPAALSALLQRSVDASISAASRIVAFEERRERVEGEAPAAAEEPAAEAETYARRGDELVQANAEEFRLRIARNQRGWPKRARR